MAILDPYADHLGAKHDDTWASRAACIGLDKLQILEGDDEQAAKRLCRGCPVIQQCGEKALKLDPRVDPDMVTAALTKKERDAIRRRYTRAKKQNPTLTVVAAGDRKPCNRCHEVKPLTEYYAEKRFSDGRRGICKTCTRADQRIASARPRPAKKEAAA